MSRPLILEKIYRTLSSDYPEIAVRYQGDNELHISKKTDDGFDIIVEIGPHENTLVFGEWHDHFALSEEGEQELLWLLSLGMSKHGRLTVIYKDLDPVRSTFETLQKDGTWEWYSESITPSLKPFARRTTRHFQNNLIPVEDFSLRNSDPDQ